MGSTAWSRESTAYTPLRFPGQYFDPETQLHYNFHRHYDPDAGRYVSSDPLGLAPADNPGAYVGNPTTWSDPLGLSPCPEVHPRKLDYLFDKDIKPDAHNTPRARQNAQQLRSIGLHDTPASRDYVTQHLKEVVRNGFSEKFTNEWGEFGKVDSVIYGPHGMRGVKSTWQIFEDGRLRLSTVIFDGAGTRFRHSH
ncbi:hypothetical protein OHA45_16030 [Streptomyces lydicus]|nr:RHS repeat-associated core domain-containing protein [Streptomyces lydicus]